MKIQIIKEWPLHPYKDLILLDLRNNTHFGRASHIYRVIFIAHTKQYLNDLNLGTHVIPGHMPHQK